jgi:glycosyltransferase involved in cell wall biosynthesis
MKVLFLSVFSVNNIDDRNIYSDLLRYFCSKGHEVYVVTPSERRLNNQTTLWRQGSAHILKVKTPNIQKTNLLEKGLATVLLPYLFKRAINRYFKDEVFDLVLYSTPPITFNRLVKSFKAKDGAKSYLLLKDIFPQNAVDLGFIKKRNPLYWFFRQKEIQLYNVSDVIGCMSPANVHYLKKHNHYLANKTIEVCSNSIEPLQKFAAENQKAEIRAKYGIPETSTVLIYGGNLGKPQGVDFLIEVIKSSQTSEKAFFVIVGGGTEYPLLSKAISATNAQNVKLIPFLPKEEFDVLLQASNVGLIFLDARFTIPNFPSRLLSYLECSLPVLAATDTATDLGQIIQDNGLGLWCRNGDLESFANHLTFFVNNKKEAIDMGNRGKRFLEENYHVAQAYQTIAKHLENV